MWSRLPVRMVLPSGEKATLTTPSLCPTKVCSKLPADGTAAVGAVVACNTTTGNGLERAVDTSPPQSNPIAKKRKTRFFTLGDLFSKTGFSINDLFIDRTGCQ